MTLQITTEQMSKLQSKFGKIKNLKLNHLTLELSMKHPKLGVLGPSFAKSGMKENFRMKRVHKEENQEETKLVFSPKLILAGI
jgi:hypothetical protein